MVYEDLISILAPHGLICRGGFHLSPDDQMESGATLALIGNAGSDLWRAFRGSPEARPDNPLADPIDRWTRRVIDDVAVRFSAHALYPFDGPPYHPFQQWAMRAGAAYPSPIGPLIDPEFGLWHAYRAALVFDARIEIPEPDKSRSPCDACADKPCLTACPVTAFKPAHYDVPACVDHLEQQPPAKCRSIGCLARHACPVGQDFAYAAEHARFHMDRFVASQRKT